MDLLVLSLAERDAARRLLGQSPSRHQLLLLSDVQLGVRKPLLLAFRNLVRSDLSVPRGLSLLQVQDGRGHQGTQRRCQQGHQVS